MIACPVCGARTAVVETRVTGVGARRRRRCVVAACSGRVTTVEVVAHDARDARDLARGNVLVSARQLKKLREIVAAISGDAT